MAVRMAGMELLPYLQGVAESAMVRDLRARHRMPFHLPNLIEQAKRLLAEEGVAVTPQSLRRAAETVAEQQATMMEDQIGTTVERWSPAIKDYVEQEMTDPRPLFRS